MQYERQQQKRKLHSRPPAVFVSGPSFPIAVHETRMLGHASVGMDKEKKETNLYFRKFVPQVLFRFHLPTAGKLTSKKHSIFVLGV
jgi:hypothetical protein